jgi:EAL domain-containing protein (putative c-di-GMP-specific phosphodiesterase class I)
VGDVEIVVTGSIGVAVAPQAGLTAESLVRAADAALATAKVRGRSSIEIARSERRSDTSGLIRLSVDLRMALESRQFLLHYQPQVDLHTGRVDALEALLRWKRSDGRLVLPKDFIPALEDTGLIVDVGAWVIRTACAQAARWREEGQQGLRVAVNLSARQFENDGLVRTVEEALRETDIPAEMLELEITESLLMSDTLQTNAILGALKSIGVRIAVDDFGTGYSSLAYLERFNVDVLKIDRSFVASIQRGNGGGSVASAIVGLAHRLGLVAVAEGVETDEQLAHLRKSGCDGVQGYLFGKPAMPAPAHEYVALMARHAAVAGRA